MLKWRPITSRSLLEQVFWDKFQMKEIIRHEVTKKTLKQQKFKTFCLPLLLQMTPLKLESVVLPLVSDSKIRESIMKIE